MSDIWLTYQNILALLIKQLLKTDLKNVKMGAANDKNMHHRSWVCRVTSSPRI
ncbi:MAG: hypothetical protein QG565_204 [Campylobacterota bacterium]|nr:hypothetical protein [Campylobacterota bacterium]MDQ1433163.1 hypothetical protein [Patescibacteria group bacterium]